MAQLVQHGADAADGRPSAKGARGAPRTLGKLEIAPIIAHDELPRSPQVNEHLAARTFLVGSALTLADLVVFGVVHPAAVSRPFGPCACMRLSTNSLCAMRMRLAHHACRAGCAEAWLSPSPRCTAGSQAGWQAAAGARPGCHLQCSQGPPSPPTPPSLPPSPPHLTHRHAIAWPCAGRLPRRAARPLRQPAAVVRPRAAPGRWGRPPGGGAAQVVRLVLRVAGAGPGPWKGWEAGQRAGWEGLRGGQREGVQ
jgi:hypothetical protein